MQGAVFAKVNTEKGTGPDISGTYNIKALPTFIVMNNQGEIVDRWLGFDGPDAWSAAVIKAKADPRTITVKREAFAEVPTADLAASLANDAACDFDYQGAVKYFRQARGLDPSRAEYFTEQILSNMFYGARSKAFSFDEIATEADLALAQPNTSVDQKESLAGMISGMAHSMGTPEKAVPYITAALAAGESESEPSDQRLNLMVENALLVEHDEAKAVELRKKMLDEGWEDDPSQLNNFAWWCFQNKLNLAEAEELALHGAEIAAEDTERANILDTAAEISAARGNHDDALVHAKRAAELDPEKDYFKQQVDRFTQEAQGSN